MRSIMELQSGRCRGGGAVARPAFGEGETRAILFDVVTKGTLAGGAKYQIARKGISGLTGYAFLDPGSYYPLPRAFDYSEYIETERELWALFPETSGRRVNFCQMGLTAQIFMETVEDGSELPADETYFLMPCSDRTLRPVRMKAFRRLTLSEFRMSHMTALKLAGKLEEAARIVDRIHLDIMGPEIARELDL